MAESDFSIGDGPTMRPVSAAGGGRRLMAGDTILGRYAVVRELGEGGMGVVYQCLDTVGGVEVAVKGLPPEVSRNEEEMEDIRVNYQIVRKLRHPNIAGVATLEKDAAAGEYYLVMDLAAGMTLKRWARRHPDAGLDTKLALLRQVAAALDYAHAEKVIHRDVKPENVMVDDDGRVKVLDFGLAAQIRSSQSRTSNMVTSKGGTPGYKSPEQWLGRPQQAPSDIYSFGVMAYWLLAGHLPFDGDDPVVLGHAALSAPVEPIADLPAHVNAALVKALAKKPEDRFPSCTAFVDALEGHAGGPRSRATALLAVAALILAVAGGWWWSLQGRKTTRTSKAALAAGSDEMSAEKGNAAVVSGPSDVSPAPGVSPAKPMNQGQAALAAQCAANMRHLATAMFAYAHANGEHGLFPAAGYYRALVLHSQTGKIEYYPFRSWISNKGNISDLNRALSNVYMGEVSHFSDAEDDCRTAVTNGAIWQATGQSLEIYRCPVHARAFERQHSRKPGWSYVMNQEFGYDWNNGKLVPFCGASINSPITVATNASGLRKDGTAPRDHGKVLMLAEVQAIDIQEEGYDPVKAVSDVSGPESDAVLEYTKESIGFNHRTSDGRYYGHVAFADGHVEKIFCPRTGSPLNRFELTRALCQGDDVVYDSKSGGYSVRRSDPTELIRQREELPRVEEQLTKARQQPVAPKPAVVTSMTSAPPVSAETASQRELKRAEKESFLRRRYPEHYKEQARRTAQQQKNADPAYTQSYYEYVVEPGHSLSRIARDFNTSVPKILSANPGLKPDRLRVGMKLIIPVDSKR